MQAYNTSPVLQSSGLPMWSAHTRALNTALCRVDALLDASTYRPETIREALRVLQETQSIRETVHALPGSERTASRASTVRVEFTEAERELLCSLIETVLLTVTRQQYRHLADVLQKLNKPQP